MGCFRLLSLAVALQVLPLGSCRQADAVVIGSKNFTEQVILGELLAQHIERQTGLEVDRRLNLGGTFICDRALRAGEIDGYVEYTGTAFTAILKNQPVSDSKEVFLRVKESYENKGMAWMEPLGFANTFAMIVRADDARNLGISTISEAAAFAPEWVAGFGYEFIEREDGFSGLAKTYNLQFSKPPRVMELGLIYRALADGQVDFIAGDSTNGLIVALDLFVLGDDKNYFPPYDAAPVFRAAILRKHPELRRALDELTGAISEERMRRMNYEVDGKRRLVKAVVKEFLQHRESLLSPRYPPNRITPGFHGSNGEGLFSREGKASDAAQVLGGPAGSLFSDEMGHRRESR